MQVTKLDKRHTGLPWFEYYVTANRPDDWLTMMNNRKITVQEYRRTFQEWRRWCQDTFGPGCERDWAVDIATDFNPPLWAWCTDERIVGTRARLYLRSQLELTIFQLKWA